MEKYLHLTIQELEMMLVGKLKARATRQSGIGRKSIPAAPVTAVDVINASGVLWVPCAK